MDLEKGMTEKIKITLILGLSIMAGTVLLTYCSPMQTCIREIGGDYPAADCLEARAGK